MDEPTDLVEADPNTVPPEVKSKLVMVPPPPEAAPAITTPKGPEIDPSKAPADLMEIKGDHITGDYRNARGEPLKPFDNARDFGVELTRRIADYEINNEQEAVDFAKRFAPPGIRVDGANGVGPTIEARDKGATVTNQVVEDHNLEGWLAHKKAQGVDIQPFLKLPTDELQKVADLDFKQAVLKYMRQKGVIDSSVPDDAGYRFIDGVMASPRQMAEGAAQLGIHAADLLGIIDHAKAETAFNAIGWDSRVRDAGDVRGTSGKVGNFVGDVGMTAALPMARVTKYGKLANFLATVGKRAGTGAVIGALQPADSESAQTQNIVANSVAMPLLAPVIEKAAAKLGGAVVNKWTEWFGDSLDKKLFNGTGDERALTPYGRTLHARLVGSGADPKLASEALEGLAQEQVRTPTVRKLVDKSAGDTMPRNTLPADEHIVGTGLAAREAVPLTGGEKTGDVGRMQNFESVKAGALGGPGMQAAANRAEQESSEALKSNVEALGSGASKEEAATNAAEAIHAADAERADAVNAKYEHLKSSSEPLTREGQAALKAELHDAYDALQQGGVDTLGTRAKFFAARLNALTESKRPPRFGEVWKLSRAINQVSRETAGTAEGVEVGKIKTAMNNWLSSADGSHFKSGSNGVAQTLKEANSDYKGLMDDFSERKTITRGSSANLSDKTGKAVSNIVALVKAAGPDGVRAGQDISAEVEKQIFGSSKGFSAQAANTVKHIAEVAPDAIPHIRDIYVNRLVGEITENMPSANVKPGTMYKVINDAVSNNRAGLKAIGFTDAQIQSLTNNAELAARKVLPPGARNVGSAKVNRVAIANGVRRVVATVLGGAIAEGAAAHYGASGAVPAAAAAFAGHTAASLYEKGVAAKAISGKVPSRPNAGVADGGKIGLATLTGATATADKSKLRKGE